jgi:uncharacterized repeat protein (TIGR02543 family)
MEAQNFTYGTPANLIANTFTKTGYDFAGWATSASGSKEYDDQDSYPTPATNTTLYAKWSANTYNITYNLNGGTNGDNPATYTIETAEITMLAPTRTGYTFGGWFADSDFSGSAVTTIAQGSTGDRTLYAKWTFNVFTGPAGGLVFYENPTYATDDWRYLEAAPYGWDYGAIDSIGIYFGSIGVYYHDNSDDDPTFQWGAFGYAVEPPATATGVGSGEINTANIVTYHNGLGDYYLDPTSYCANNDGTVAAKVCADYSLENGGVTYDDWFLPSKDELYLMHSNLALHGLGGISDGYGYWSSSEVDDDGYYAWYEVVYDGEDYDEVWVERKIGARVRPIRAYY